MKLNGNNRENKHTVPQHVPQTDEGAKRSGSGKRALRRGLISIAVIAIVVIGVVIGYSLWEAPPPVVGPGSNPASSGAAISLILAVIFALSFVFRKVRG